jgi:hypothetical protein
LTAGTNFLGTTDAVDFVVKTGGNAATNERMRVLSAGQTVVNCTTIQAGDLFSVYASGYAGAIGSIGSFAINGYSSGSGAGIYGENTGAGAGVIGLNGTTGTGVIGYSTSTGTGVLGTNDAINTGVEGDIYNATPVNCNSGVSTGVFGYNNNTVTSPGGACGVYGMTTATAGAAHGIIGYSSSPTGVGVYAKNSSAGALGTGMMGIGNNTTGSYLVNGSGGAFTGTSTGSYSIANTATGTGVIGVGNNQTASTITGGSGGAFSGTEVGVYGYAVTAATGTGVIGNGNGYTTTNTLTSGSGGAFNGTTTGVYGYANTNNNGFGGYFENSGTAYAYVGGRTGGTDYKIIGVGSVSTIVDRTNGSKATMFCPESPEILFQDYGTATLVNGRVHVSLDPIFTNNIFVSEEHPLKVFVQLNGDCKGVYVTNRTAQGFDVVELDGGTSNIEITWTVVANRKDRVVNGEVVSKHVDVRFPDAPLQMKKNTSATQTQEVDKASNPALLTPAAAKVKKRK